MLVDPMTALAPAAKSSAPRWSALELQEVLEPVLAPGRPPILGDPAILHNLMPEGDCCTVTRTNPESSGSGWVRSDVTQRRLGNRLAVMSWFVDRQFSKEDAR